MASRVLVALRVAATPERAFAAFTEEIGSWWRHNGLFQFTPRHLGQLAFEPGLGGRLIESQPDGRVFEIGRITAWEPPSELAFQWRQASFSADQETEVHVRFELVGEETRVTVEHFGWDAIPAAHAARHGFPIDVFLRRSAEWWQELLSSYKARITG
ncbi:MAG: SRPBCC domain-containing protein [Chloroflexota bacterium]